VQEFERHKRALDLEFRIARHESLQNLARPLAERVESSRALGNLLYQGVDGRRTSHHVFHFEGAAGRFRVGDHVRLTRADATLLDAGLNVVIDELTGNRLVLRQAGREEDMLQPGISYVLDEKAPTWQPNYQRLSYALALAEYSRNPGDRLRALLDGTLVVANDVEDSISVPADLAGERAQLAFRYAMTRNVTAVQGPPGTGKTYLLARIARACVDQGLRVVLCCFTHRAINNALRAMVEAGIPPEKLGKVTGSDERDLPEGIAALDRKTYWAKPRAGFIAGMTVHAAFDPFGKPLNSTAFRSSDAPPDRAALDEQAFWPALDRYNRRIVETTRLPVDGALADVILFDEAGQLTIPMALCALPAATRAVFFGDHAQLPPINPGALRFDTHPSIFHLLADRYPQTLVRLNESHRMNQELCAFPADAFYDGDLRPGAAASGRELAISTSTRLDETGERVAADSARVVSAVARANDSTSEATSTGTDIGPIGASPYAALLAPKPASIFVEINHTGCAQESPLEAILAADIAFTLLVDHGLDPKTGLAILAAHRRQTNAIREAFQRLAGQRGISTTRTQRFLDDLLIDTVDRMQGQERDVILYSLTASDADTMDHEREFLFLPNRFNVAITRARKKLLVLGSRRFFHHLPHALLHAGWQGEEGVETKRMLAEANLFKQWYMAHRATKVDMTTRAQELAP
jgi:DNA replication ATP-dependent helicase Dna2